jgi:tripartite-type tricarboxylate transporter receptor subunit TctC
VTGAKRSTALPDVPAIGEFVPGYEASGWFGIAAPRGTPAEIVGKLNNEIGAGLEDSKFKARLLALGVEPRHDATRIQGFHHCRSRQMGEGHRVCRH